MASLVSDFYDFNDDDPPPPDDGKDICGRKYDRFLDSYMEVSQELAWEPEDGEGSDIKNPEVLASKATPPEPVQGPGTVDCLQNTTARLPRGEHRDNREKDLDVVPAGITNAPEKPTEAKAKKAHVYGPEATPAFDMAQMTIPDYDRLDKPISQKDFGKPSKPRIVPRLTKLAEKAYQEMRYGKTCIKKSRRSANKVALYPEPQSGKSCKKIVVKRPLIPKHDKAASSIAFLKDYQGGTKAFFKAKRCTLQLDPSLVKMADDVGSMEKLGTVDESDIQLEEKENTDVEALLSKKASTIEDLDRPAADATELHQLPHTAIAGTSEKPSQPSTNAKKELGRDWIDAMQKQLEKLTWKWKQMYEEEKAKLVRKTSAKKPNTRESMWYTNRCYKEDATAYFCDNELKKRRPESQAACFRVEASLGYTAPVRGTSVVRTPSDTSIHSDDELSPLPDLQLDIKSTDEDMMSMSNSTASETSVHLDDDEIPPLPDLELDTESTDEDMMIRSNSLPRLEVLADISDEIDIEYEAENTPNIMQLVDTTNYDVIAQSSVTTVANVFDDEDATLSPNQCISDDILHPEQIQIDVDITTHILMLYHHDTFMGKVIKQLVLEEEKAAQKTDEIPDVDSTPHVPNVRDIPESKDGLNNRFKSSKIGMAIFKKSEKKPTEDRALKPQKKGLMKIFKSSSSKVPKGEDEASSSKNHKGISSKKENCQANAKHPKKGGIMGYLRSSWIGRKLFKAKSETHSKDKNNKEDDYTHEQKCEKQNKA